MKLGYLDPQQVLEGLERRPALTHVALTGRGAPASLLERADLVTEMREIKHYFNAGQVARVGIES